MTRRSLPLLLVCLALGVGAAVSFTALGPREYTSRARVFVGLGTTDASQSTRLIYRTIASAQSYADFAQGDEVVDLVAGQVGGGSEAIAEAVDVEVVQDTTMLDITATDDDAHGAQELAETYAGVAAQEIRGLEDPPVMVAELVDHAHLPEDPEPRPWPRNLAIGAGAALLLGLLLATATGIRSARPRRPAA